MKSLLTIVVALLPVSAGATGNRDEVAIPVIKNAALANVLMFLLRESEEVIDRSAAASRRLASL